MKFRVLLVIGLAVTPAPAFPQTQHGDVFVLAPSGGGGAGGPTGPAGGVLAGEYPDPTLATPLAGVGACSLGHFVTATVSAAAPTCSALGADKQILFNDGGTLVGDAELLYNKSTNALTVESVVLKAGAFVDQTFFGGSGLEVRNSSGTAVNLAVADLMFGAPATNGVAPRQMWRSSADDAWLGANFTFYWSDLNSSSTNRKTNLKRVADGVLAVGVDTSAGTGWLQWAGECYTTADATNATTTFALSTCAIDGLVAGRRYGFECSFFLADSTSADGAKVDFGGGTAAETYFRAHATGLDAALVLSTQIDDLTDPVAAPSLTGDGHFEVHGSFEPASSGTFVPRFAQVAHTTGTLTLYRGSKCVVHDMTKP